MFFIFNHPIIENHGFLSNAFEYIVIASVCGLLLLNILAKYSHNELWLIVLLVWISSVLSLGFFCIFFWLKLKLRLMRLFFLGVYLVVFVKYILLLLVKIRVMLRNFFGVSLNYLVKAKFKTYV
jgi:hypothetical protein